MAKGMNMQVDNRMSVGNIVTVAVLVISLVSSWTMMGSSIDNIKHDQVKIYNKLEMKSDKSVVDVKFAFIQEDLHEIKEMIKEL